MWGLFGVLYVAVVIAVLLNVAGATWASLAIAVAAAAILSFAWLTR
jgi:hypothetical protein